MFALINWRAGRALAGCVVLGAFSAKAADLTDIKTPAVSQYVSDDYYFGGSARFLAGDLAREGASYFRLWKDNGNSSYTLVTPSFLSFSNNSDFHGLEAEAYLGRRYGDKSLEIVAGGGSIWSDSSFSGIRPADAAVHATGFLLTIASPTPGASTSGNTTFRWLPTNQFDAGDIRYSNTLHRDEGFIGIRPGFLLGDGPVGLKDGGSLKDPPAYSAGASLLVQPLAFVSAGRTTVGERFSGATDGDASLTNLNVHFAYNNSISSDFYGAGLGLSIKGPLLDSYSVHVGYFGSVKGAIEVQNAEGRAFWSYNQALPPPFDNNAFGVLGCTGGQPSGACNSLLVNSASAKSSAKYVSADDATYSISAEFGLTFNLAAGVDFDIGARYRRFEAPQMIVNGVDDAHINFGGASEIGGFAGLKIKL
jgi:hypothetical protein